MPRTRTPAALRRKALDAIIDSIKDLTALRAADKLQVSRQTIYNIRARVHSPSLALIQRACHSVDLDFDFNGTRFNRKTVPAPLDNPLDPPSAQIPLDLQEVISRIDHRHFEVIDARPVGRAVQITLRLTIPA